MQHTAKGIASLGRNGDDTLLHVNKEELAGLQALLGPVTVNPETGLPEAFAWTDILKMLGVGIASAMTGGAAAPALGALGGAAVGAGTGALVGGAVDAASGKGFTRNILGNALSGAISGYGGSTLNTPAAGTATPNIATPAQQIGGAPVDPNMAIPSQAPGFVGPAPKYAGYSGLSGDTMSSIRNLGGEPSVGPITKDMVVANSGAATPSFMDRMGDIGNKLMTKEGGEAAFKYGIPAIGLGMSLQDNSDPNYEQNRQRAEALQNEQDRRYFTGLGFGWSPNINVPRQVGQTVGYGSGYAVGGPIEVNSNVGGTPLNINMPARYAEEFVTSGAPERLERIGFGDVTPGFATGGYINTQQFNAEDAYPQSQIPRAQAYPAATPQRHEVVQSFEGGGFIEGPGDGMSDDIDANIEGIEPVRVADGEYRVSARLVAMLGGGDAEKGAAILDAMTKHIRAKAYKDGHKGGQIKQDAGKLAAEKMFQRASRG